MYCYIFRQPSHAQSGSAKFNEAFSAFRRKINLMWVTGNLGKKGEEIYREMTEWEGVETTPEGLDLVSWVFLNKR